MKNEDQIPQNLFSSCFVITALSYCILHPCISATLNYFSLYLNPCKSTVLKDIQIWEGYRRIFLKRLAMQKFNKSELSYLHNLQNKSI